MHILFLHGQEQIPISRHFRKKKKLISDLLLIQTPQRTSNLDAPIMLLSGHEGEVFCCKFSPDGSYLASSGFDRLICKCKGMHLVGSIYLTNNFVRFTLEASQDGRLINVTSEK